ncbi:hypothetical protein J6590_023368 [Homalodisca vitripennis]|nr:hypothetical protein J6590_023368 [Homalodisca vitripennis]
MWQSDRHGLQMMVWLVRVCVWGCSLVTRHAADVRQCGFVQWFTHCGPVLQVGSERMLAASVDYRHGLADVMQCGSQFSVLGSERMLAASVDYRHGLADVRQCGSQFSGLLTVVLCYSVG